MALVKIKIAGTALNQHAGCICGYGAGFHKRLNGERHDFVQRGVRIASELNGHVPREEHGSSLRWISRWRSRARTLARATMARLQSIMQTMPQFWHIDGAEESAPWLAVLGASLITGLMLED